MEGVSKQRCLAEFAGLKTVSGAGLVALLEKLDKLGCDLPFGGIGRKAIAKAVEDDIMTSTGYGKVVRSVQLPLPMGGITNGSWCIQLPSCHGFALSLFLLLAC